MTNSINRRTAMLAIASTGAIATTSAAAMVDVNAAEAAAWEAALAEHDAALAAKNAFEPTYDRIEAADEAGRPSMDVIPWNEFTFEDRHHVARIMDIEKRWSLFLEGEGKWWWAPGREDARKAQFRAALDTIRDFRRQEAEHHERSGMNAASTSYDALWDRLGAAENALLDLPAPHGPALLWKLEHLFADDRGDGFCASYSAELMDKVLADARRLLSHGRA
ncbi:MAG TPA: hypothetical protein VF631_05220 [Allosphingosinicella sp.]|jgi:hypothetical protein|uniref:hypothetical protein n=1 Tax=Allosphingosinicella sp. TaxID=2823234 RepID=UPI002F29B323